MSNVVSLRSPDVKVVASACQYEWFREFSPLVQRVLKNVMKLECKVVKEKIIKTPEREALF